ncbi:MAG: DUF4276 family protein [Capsulimonadaceae bacterium]
MMRVIVYVEGPSDKLAMEEVLRALVVQKYTAGVQIEFFEAPAGDKKESVVIRVPQKAVNLLRNDPSAIVIAMPDLSPKNKGCPHETVEELKAGIMANFDRALKKHGIDDVRIRDRFKVHCFKHDLEALLLACEDELKLRLNADKLLLTWHTPVEDQNHVRYPGIVVDELFNLHGAVYKGTVDAPLILGMAGLHHLVDNCPQCFKPFVEYLESLTPSSGGAG